MSDQSRNTTEPDIDEEIDPQQRLEEETYEANALDFIDRDLAEFLHNYERSGE